MHFILYHLLQVSAGRHALFVMIAAFIVGALILLMVAQAIFNAWRKNKAMLQEEVKLMQSRITVQEETSQQIGSELHDNIGQLLTTTKMFIDIAITKLPVPPPTLLLANVSLDKAITELRSVSTLLDTKTMATFDLYRELMKEVERINMTGKIRINIHREDHLIPLVAEKQFGLSRIFKEGIQNVLKHARASVLDIRILHNNEKLTIEMEDNGIGFNTGEPSTGVGIKHMRDRVRALNGDILFISGKSGTTVRIEIPI